MLPLALAAPAPGAWELHATGDSGQGLAREGVVSEAVPAGTSLRLVEVAWYDHISRSGRAFVFEVADGRMVGTRLNIWDIERDLAWQQRLPSISRAISMIVPAGAPEIADRDRAYARLRDVETTLETYRRFANEHWVLLARGLTRPLEAAELPQFDRP